MANPQGTPIWYELVAADPDAAKAFYDPVMGWTVEDRPAGPMDYRMIGTPDGDAVGGLAGIGADTPAAAATPGWRMYVGVDDVDATVAAILRAGGSERIAPFDLPNVGRMALVADPQGIAFFVMRGHSPQRSTSFDPHRLGRCSWNELATPDQAGANAFYAEVFGWTYPDAMTMPGDMGDYVFVDCAGQRLGATMTARVEGPPPNWQFYFRVADIDAAAEAVRAGGGTVLMGPHDVPGGDRIIVASDPSGALFGAVAAGKAA